MDKQHGLSGKRSNAAKPDDERASSYIHARCKTSDKSTWVKTAQSEGIKLTDWIITTLNAAARKNEQLEQTTKNQPPKS